MEDELKKFQQKSSDLSDIVLEKSPKRRPNTKKWLLAIASAILLALIVLMVLNMFKKEQLSPSQDTIANIGQDTPIEQNEQIEATPTTEVANSVKEDQPEKKNIFKKEPIIDESSDTDLKFEEMVKKLKEQDAIIKSSKVKKEEQQVAQATPQPLVKEVKPQEIKTIVQQPEVPVVVTPQEHTVIIQESPKPRVEPRRVIHHPTKPKAVVHNRAKPSDLFNKTRVGSVPSGYYIQVGATSRFPDRRFLNKIKAAGFDYAIQTVNRNGRKIKKVLVGPYSSRSQAKRHLSKAKSQLASGAYILRVQ